jgi:hypothetical protein
MEYTIELIEKLISEKENNFKVEDNYGILTLTELKEMLEELKNNGETK